MSFDDSERSAQAGRPVYFVKYVRSTKEWYYTNVDQDLTFDGHLYLGTPMDIPDTLQSGDAKAEEVQISMSSTTAIAQYLDGNTPSSAIAVFIRKAHVREDELDGSFTAPLAAQAPIVWVGEILAVRRPTINKRVFLCNTLSLSMMRSGLRLTWSRTCPHMLYERGCFVDRELHRVAAPTVTVVDGLNVTVSAASAFADGWFSGGYIEWLSEPGIFERRGIERHVGSSLALFGSTRGVSTGTTFSLFPGCSRLAPTCDSKFGNILNFGGIKDLQGKSPFDGTQVF